MPKLQAYRAQWAALPPGSQAEEYERDVAVQRAEAQLRSEGQTFIDGERERLSNRAAAVSTSSTDIQNAARVITAACRSRLVDVEEVADQLDELEKQARRNRDIIARIEEQQDRNEQSAEDPVGLMERLYDKYPAIMSPVDMLPGFRTDSEQSGPGLRRR